MTSDGTKLDDAEVDDQGLEVDTVDDLDYGADDYDYEVDDGGAVADDVSEAVPTPRVGRRQHVVGSVLLARIARAGLWLLVGAAVLMAALALLAVTSSPEQPENAPTGDDQAETGDAVLAAGFAQMAVRRYVGEAGQDTEEVLTSFLDGDAPDLRGVTPAGFYVLDAVTLDVEDRGDGYWAATVAADLMAAVEEQYQPVGVRYYTVGVIIDGEAGPVLADLPSQVAPPENAASPGLLAGMLATPDRDSPQLAAVREFLGALLLGEGSIQRYTAPGTTIAAITPPPFATLEIDSAAVADPEAEQTLVRASVLAVDEHGLAQRLHYTMDLRLRDGRWEVVELFDAPPLAKDEPVPAEEATPQ